MLRKNHKDFTLRLDRFPAYTPGMAHHVFFTIPLPL
jgi:hypothetical protein